MRTTRSDLKRVLARATVASERQGMTVLIYHRVGGPGLDELDVAVPDFAQQVGLLSNHRVVSLDSAMDAIDRRDARSRVVLTFDDGFQDVYDNAWPLLREAQLPFTLYLATAYVDGVMRWSGSTARDAAAPALAWEQVEEMVASGLCTVGSHTHSHVRPELLSERELDRCDEAIFERLGILPAHFAYPWGTAVPAMEPTLRQRYRSAATGRLGRNLPGCDQMRLARVPVRRSDPPDFFAAKLSGALLPERLYGAVVAGAKRAGIRA